MSLIAGVELSGPDTGIEYKQMATCKSKERKKKTKKQFKFFDTKSVYKV